MRNKYLRLLIPSLAAILASVTAACVTVSAPSEKIISYSAELPAAETSSNTYSALIDDEDLDTYFESLSDKTVNVIIGNHEEFIPEDIMKEMLFLKDGLILFNEGKLDEYILYLRDKYETYGKARSFHTSTGEDITITKGNYGWKFDVDATKNALKEALLKDYDSSMDVVFSIMGRRDPFNEIAGTYFEVSIADQHVWMYKNGELIVESPCCTGDVKTGANTRCGIFAVTFKKRDTILKGPDWNDPVSYWVPFDGNIGFHDATWRSPEEFGGDVYLENGSHGCVNLPLEAASIIYENVDMDTPIIVY